MQTEQQAFLFCVADRASSSLQCCRQSNQQFSSVLQTEKPAVLLSVADKATSSSLHCCKQLLVALSAILKRTAYCRKSNQYLVLISVAD